MQDAVHGLPRTPLIGRWVNKAPATEGWSANPQRTPAGWGDAPGSANQYAVSLEASVAGARMDPAPKEGGSS
jgi:hypothetical protein